MSKAVSKTIAALILIIVVIIAGVAVYAYYAFTAPPTNLTVYALWSGNEEYNFQQVLGNFTQNTGIEVDYFSYTTQDLLISVPLQLQSPPYRPDVILVPWPYWIDQVQSNLAPVTDLVNKADFSENFLTPVTDSSGTLWGAPFKLSGKPGFWYRPSFFQQNNLTVPQTYDELVNTLLPSIQSIPGIEQAVASGDTVGWPLSDQAEGFIMGLGGYQLQLDLETGPPARNWTDPQVQEVFDDLTQLLDSGYFSPPAEWTSQIAKLWNGQYGIYWLGDFITTQPQVEDISDIDFFGFPGTNGVVGAVDYAVITKEAPHMDQARQLVQYLAGAQAQEILVRQGGSLATNLNVPSSAYQPIGIKVVDFMSQPGINIVPDLDDTIGGQWQTTFWDQLKGLWTNPSQQNMESVLNTLEQSAIEQQGP